MRKLIIWSLKWTCCEMPSTPKISSSKSSKITWSCSIREKVPN
jgi:hypothetical protein